LQPENNHKADKLGHAVGFPATMFASLARMDDAFARSVVKPSQVCRFGMALLSVLAIAAVRYALAPDLGERVAYLPFVIAILGLVLWCGLAPAIFASVLSLAFGFYFSGPDDLSFGDELESIVFVAVAAGVIILGETINRSRRKAFASDRNAERRAREAIEVAEELNLLIDGAHGHAIYMLDPAGHVTIWNKGAERLKGWHESEILGKHTSVFYPSDALAAGKPEADLARAVAEGRFDEEDWRARKDGTEFLASVSMTALFDDVGALRGFAKIVSDITEQRAIEEAIRWRWSHLSSILSTVPDAMVVIDESGLILTFSPAAETLFGYKEDEVLGKNVCLLMPSPNRERHDGYISRYLQTGEKRNIGRGRVFLAERKDGTTFPVELFVGEANNASERMFTGFLRDLTERRKAEEQLEALQSELIHVSRVGAMGTMASTLAHELNQPIAAITNYVEAARDLLAEPAAEDLPMIVEALDDAANDALRAGQIIRRLRDFVAHGHAERSIESLPALINEAALLGLMGACERGIEATFDLDPEASPVFVDRVQIQQVLINLIRNACEAMNGCSVRQLMVMTRPDRDGFVRVTVADTGPGIAEEVVEQLFRAFVSTKQDGMGLGLSICRTIIEANEGNIWMEPREDGGTNFHFTLPRAQTEEGHA
jgi:two-component system sensor kinase FixL